MRTFTIKRTYLLLGTRGVLSEGEVPLCRTIERPESGDVTCIPEGWYIAKKYNSPANKCQVWLLQDVPNRTMIEFHIANYPHELLGCIAPGTEDQTGPNMEPGVANSKVAFDAFMSSTADETEIAFEIK